MSKLLTWVFLAAIAFTALFAQAGESKYRFDVSLVDHTKNESEIDENGQPLPPSNTPGDNFIGDPNNPELRPVGDAISGRMTATINTIASEIARLPEVNTRSINDNLAGFIVTVLFKDTNGSELNAKPVGNLFPLSSTADKKGELTSRIIGKLVNNGKRFKFSASYLNLQQALSIPPEVEPARNPATDPTDSKLVVVPAPKPLSGGTNLQLEIQAKGTHPVTGEEITITIAKELVTVSWTGQTRYGVGVDVKVLENTGPDRVTHPFDIVRIYFPQIKTSKVKATGIGTPLPIE
ncbi:MAG TPA: hypothetical protein VEK08_25360 [Planctomycetota bacterium]|nr:hypothetical protein [Planctomycetota bacterium]